MIFVVAGTYQAYRNLCDKLNLHPLKDAQYIRPDTHAGLHGVRLGDTHKLILTCGYANQPDWFYREISPRLFDYVPEKISCCHKKDIDSFI